MGSENRLGSVKPGPEIKSQTLPWVLPVQGGAPGATGTISVVWAVPRSIELRGMGGSPEKRVRQPGASVSRWLDGLLLWGHRCVGWGNHFVYWLLLQGFVKTSGSRAPRGLKTSDVGDGGP